MDEKETQEEEKKPEENAAVDSKEGDKPEVYKPIDDANLAAKRVEDATKALKEQLDRQEEMAAKRALGGTTEAGGDIKKPEITDKEYAEKAIAGELDVKKE